MLEVNIVHQELRHEVSHCKSNARTQILTENCLLKAVQVSPEKQIHKLYALLFSPKFRSYLLWEETLSINIKKSIILFERRNNF